MKNVLAAAVPFVSVAMGLYAAGSAWLAILLYHAGVVVVLTLEGWRDPLRRARGGWRVGIAAAAAVACAAAGPALYLLWPYLDATPGGLQARLADFGFCRRSWIVFAVYYATVHPFLEELFWRGRGRVDTIGPNWQDAAFAGYHMLVLPYFIGPAWVGVCFGVLLLASWMWRVAARRFGGLGVPLFSHAVADVAVVSAATLIAFRG
jgi:hypothetical protein